MHGIDGLHLINRFDAPVLSDLFECLFTKGTRMINEYIRYRIPVDRADSFIKDYQAAGSALQASPHCHGYRLTRCEEAPDQFILHIRWDSLEGHLNGFRTSPEFRTFFSSVRSYVNNIEEMQHYHDTPVLWSR
jgi:quinol monooxygenase YgiN